MLSRILSLTIALWIGAPSVVCAQKFYTYVGTLGKDHVLLAWGTTTGSNTIGLSSRSHGKAEVRVGERTVSVTDRNWIRVDGLQPDSLYEYEVRLNGKRIGDGRVRTWPEKAERLRFFVIGDYGTGDRNQRQVARAMWEEFQRLDGDNPVRFVLTTGDNIYGELNILLRYRNTGETDDEWDSKFFAPYESLIRRIPFYASPGNHDGNESERRGDLAAYLDNFFFPSPEPARYYRFSYGGFVDFFALDTTTNSETGPPRPVFLRDSDQHTWLQANLAQSEVRWKIPFMHHPPYNAGPRHPSVKGELAHFLELFRKHGVSVVFTGHEHNFQYTEANRETGGIRYVITGAGGELRSGNVRREMRRAEMEGWAAQLHFLSVEIDGDQMSITPLSTEPIRVVGRDGQSIKMPLRIKAR